MEYLIIIIFVIFLILYTTVWECFKRYFILAELKNETQHIRNHCNFKHIRKDDFNTLILIERNLKDFDNYTGVSSFIKHRHNPYKEKPQVYFKEYTPEHAYKSYNIPSDYWCSNSRKELKRIERSLDNAFKRTTNIYNKDGKLRGVVMLKRQGMETKFKSAPMGYIIDYKGMLLQQNNKVIPQK